MTVRLESPSRRQLLASLGAGATAVLGGCTAASGDPEYEAGEVDQTAGQPRSAGEMAAAEAVAEREPADAASPLGVLALEDHEFVVEDGYEGPTVQGVVANTGDDRVELVEVRVRVYDDSGTQRGRYLDSTGDLAAGTDWRFEVVLLTSAENVAGYDIAHLGIPA